jgi:hypothetical protein
MQSLTASRQPLSDASLGLGAFDSQGIIHPSPQPFRGYHTKPGSCVSGHRSGRGFTKV